MKLRMLLLSVLVLTCLSAYSNASDLDASLNKAKAEGRIVMLELGSVGCIPCEQMKPVMTKLSDTYKGKLDVLFIDVKKDHGTQVRRVHDPGAGLSGQDRQGVPPARRVLFLRRDHCHAEKDGDIVATGNLVCCFGYSEEDITRDVLANKSCSLIRERILAEKKGEGCNCGTNHPLGR